MSTACPRCEGPIGCVECNPQTMRLRAEGRRLKKRVEELEGQEPPEPELPPDLEEMKGEIGQLRLELEVSNRKLADACWPIDHEKKDLPEDVQELQALVKANEKKWQDAWRSSEELRGKIREAYNEVISRRMATQMPFVFEMGTAVEDFLKEWFH